MAYVDGFVVPVPTKNLAAMMDSKKMPFDGKRMCFGGFKVFIDS